VSAPTAQPPAAGPLPAAGSESCPLCGASLDPDQDWCLRCGAAARTRLASAPNWKAPIAVLAIIAVLALAVIAVAVVKLAGKSSPSATTSTLTVPAAAAPATGAAAPATGSAAATTATTATTAIAPAPAAAGATSATGSTPAGVTHKRHGKKPISPAAQERLRETLEALRKSASK
jgi:hypothetical protein